MDKDTGSPEYQVGGMTERIRCLREHLRAHPKDYSTRRGLVAMVNKRRRLFNYLFTENVERYKALLWSMGILRHKNGGDGRKHTGDTRNRRLSRNSKQTVGPVLLKSGTLSSSNVYDEGCLYLCFRIRERYGGFYVLASFLLPFKVCSTMAGNV